MGWKHTHTVQRALCGQYARLHALQQPRGTTKERAAHGVQSADCLWCFPFFDCSVLHVTEQRAGSMKYERTPPQPSHNPHFLPVLLFPPRVQRTVASRIPSIHMIQTPVHLEYSHSTLFAILPKYKQLCVRRRAVTVHTRTLPYCIAVLRVSPIPCFILK